MSITLPTVDGNNTAFSVRPVQPVSTFSEKCLCQALLQQTSREYDITLMQTIRAMGMFFFSVGERERTFEAELALLTLLHHVISLSCPLHVISIYTSFKSIIQMDCATAGENCSLETAWRRCIKHRQRESF